MLPKPSSEGGFVGGPDAQPELFVSHLGLDRHVENGMADFMDHDALVRKHVALQAEDVYRRRGHQGEKCRGPETPSQGCDVPVSVGELFVELAELRDLGDHGSLGHHRDMHARFGQCLD